MAKERITHHCSDCGFASPKWFGRCPDCGAWSTAAERTSGSTASASAGVTSLAAAEELPVRFGSGLGELDRVVGGGFVPGSCVLLAGEPGIGKSTIVLQTLGGMIAGGRRTLLATGEESLDQVSLRAGRLGLARDRFRVIATASLEDVLAASISERAEVVIVDSIQTVETRGAEQGPGSVVQVRDCAIQLARHAKETGAVVVLVGHVTKEGTVAGPKTLEHLVDVVLSLDGDRTGSIRLLRASKNRFGSCEETGVFVMGAAGLEGVPDPSAMLLADRRVGVPGSVVFPGLEGSRPVLVEIQALCAASELPSPRRVPIGLDPRRLSLLLGVLATHGDMDTGKTDVFAAAAGGLTVKEPAADLAIAAALTSALSGNPMPDGTVAVGEIGLGGEVRRVPGLERRLIEARRLGFERALAPRGVERVPSGLELVEVRDVVALRTFLGPKLSAVGAG